MTTKTLADISEAMRDIDFTMLATRGKSGDIASRPMSNNRDVDYDGDSYFFTDEKTNTVEDIQRDNKVALTFAGSKGIFGKPPMFIHLAGQAELIRDKARFQEHWVSGLDRWFQQGPDTPGIVLIKVHASRIAWWDGEENGEIVL